MSDHVPYFTEEEAEAAVRAFIIRSEVEGVWDAICECGQLCGMGLLEPTAEDWECVACPACDGTGENGKVRWIKRGEA